ncbi:MAG: hypothetical protein WC294_10450 [Methanoregula sp.]|jgi:hypothetical protein
MATEYAEHSIDKAIQRGILTADDAALIREFVAEVKVPIPLDL